ncbi:30S ribosomal protein S20 [Patescibacteria group bacterium]|nr:30S ribosomal protein S20 [Patescibacteria group bacterium]
MPIIKSAIKKVRKDKTRTIRNKKRKIALKALIKQARTNKTAKDLQSAFSALDKAAKVHLIHPNKSARLKSRLSKLVSRPSLESKSKITKSKSKSSKKVSVDPQKSVKKNPVKKAE